jgi:dihydroxyacetone kinase-like predicted kinase
MKTKILGAFLIAALAFTSAAQAQTHTPVINRKQHKLERRIHQGVRSGELTRNEARHLQREDMRIRREKRMAMADGKMTFAERQRIRRHERMLSRAINRDEHNNKFKG